MSHVHLIFRKTDQFALSSSNIQLKIAGSGSQTHYVYKWPRPLLWENKVESCRSPKSNTSLLLSVRKSVCQKSSMSEFIVLKKKKKKSSTQMTYYFRQIRMDTLPKPLEGKPATFSQKSVTANANGKETRGVFFNGCQWKRGFSTLNKQLFRGNSSPFNESTAYLPIFSMIYTK